VFVLFTALWYKVVVRKEQATSTGCTKCEHVRLMGVLSLFFYARNLGYGVRLSGLCAYVGTCVSIVG